MKHIVMFSGGAGSWAAAKRVAERYGTRDLYLVFADTLIEDKDLYRFIDQAAENVGGRLVVLADGRTPWEVFKDVRYLGNTRIDPCSRVLKRDLIRAWLDRTMDPKDSVIYLGIDWTEEHRFVKAKKHWDPWTVEAPLCQAPWVSKTDILNDLREQGIEPPRLYAMGFAHNNCGGGCVKAGMGHFKLLWEKLPEVYAEWEKKEQEVQDHIGKPVTILRDRTGGKVTPMSLKVFREERLEAGCPVDKFDIGGCGCFSAEDDEASI